jgi:hypothetical protein
MTNLSSEHAKLSRIQSTLVDSARLLLVTLGEGSAVESHDIILQKYPHVIWVAENGNENLQP